MIPGILASVAAALFLSAVPAGDDLPAAPAGLAWKRIDAVRAAFLVPEGWHFKQEKNGDTIAFFITAEDIEKNGGFQTGLTVNVIHLKKDAAPERAALFIADLAEAAEILTQWHEKKGVMTIFGCKARKEEAGYPPLRMHTLAVGNGRTNALYLMTFESPESSWEDAWKKGRFILEEFVLDDGY
jgi:hypothetical protein